MDSISQPISLSAARPTKGRKKLAPYRNPFNNDEEDQEIYQSYRNLWNTLQEKFEDVKVNMSKKFVDDITDKIKSYEYSGESILTLALLTGVNVSDHDDLFHLIRQEIKSSTSYPIVFVRSCHDISVKPVIERLVQSFLSGTETDVLDRIEYDSEESEDDQKCPMKIKKSMCSLSRLHLWHKSRGKDGKDRTPLIIIIPDVESFCSRVLNDFFNILSVYVDRIPFIVILGIATDLNALPQRGILQNFEFCIFRAQPSLTFLDLVLEKIFLTADCPFQLHGRILDMLIDMFTYYNFSIEFFIRGIKFCVINHFLKSKLNVLCCPIDQLPEVVESLDSDQFDSLSKLPSVCEYNKERKSKKLPPVNAKNIKTNLEAHIKDLHQRLSRFHTAIRCFHVIVKSVGGSDLHINKLRNIYCKAMRKDFTKTSEFSECMIKLKFLSFNAIQETIKAMREPLLSCEGDDKMVELMNKLEEHYRIAEEANDMKEPKSTRKNLSNVPCSPLETLEQDLTIQNKNFIPSNGWDPEPCHSSILPETVDQLHTEECSPRKKRREQERPTKVSAPPTLTKVIDQSTVSQSVRGSPRNKISAKEESITPIRVLTERNGPSTLKEEVNSLNLSNSVRSSPRKRPSVKEELITPNKVLVEKNEPSTYEDDKVPLNSSQHVRNSPREKLSVKEEPTSPNGSGVLTEMNTPSVLIEKIDPPDISVQNGRDELQNTPSKVSFEERAMSTPTRQNIALRVKNSPRKLSSPKTPTKTDDRSNSQILSPPKTPCESGAREAVSISTTPADLISEFNITPPSTGQSRTSSRLNKSAASRSDFIKELRQNASSAGKALKSEQQKRTHDLIEFLKNDFFKELLECPTRYSFHEVLLYDDVEHVKNYTSVNHKGRIEKALQDPQSILKCKCCKLKTTNDFPESWPDLCIVYKLHTECTNDIINLNDWLKSFDSKVSRWQEGDEISPEVYNRFRQAVRELQLMGFVEPHSRKIDFMKKVDFIKGSRKSYF